jgi:hypothetical protein
MTRHHTTLLQALPLVILCALPRSAAGETLSEAHSHALREYYAGHYDKAAEELERILAVPVENADLHYNLGCAYFRLGKPGPAIYHFERALTLDPSDEDARFNLDTARAHVASRVKDELKGAAGDAWWVRFVSTFSLRTWTVLFLALWWVTCAILLALRFMQPGPLRAGLIASNSFVAVVTLLCALCLFGRVYLGGRVTMGIVLPDQLAVREGPDAGTKTSFILHAGLRVRLQSKEGDWVRIRLQNGLEGWAPRREVGVL